jgi:hypothetical protein
MGKKDLAKNSFLNNAVNILILIAFGYFLFRLFYFAGNISDYVPPDEVTHFGKCMIFSKALLLPKDSEASYSLGLVTHIPYLYYFIMGKLVTLNISPVSDLVFLRLFNCILSFLTVFFGYKWIKRVTDNRTCQLFFIVLLTNTPMFTFTGAFVNYDNLLNLFAALSLYYMHLFFQKPGTKHFLLCGVFLLGGCLTKTAFFPLVPIFIGILCFRTREHFMCFFEIIKKAVRESDNAEKCLTVLFIVMLVLNASLYVGNIIKFKKIEPGPGHVLTEEQAMNYRLFARDRINGLYREGKLTFDEAVQETQKIKNPGDQAHAVSLLQISRQNKIQPIAVVDRVQYAEIWFNIMLQRTVGIAGHLVLHKSAYILACYQLIFFFSFLCFVRYFRPLQSGFYIVDAFIISLFYSLFLMQVVNYSVYTDSLSIGTAITGRYLFPVIIPCYGLMAYYMVKPFNKPVNRTIIFIVSCYFIWGDFPYFMQHVTPQWYF